MVSPHGQKRVGRIHAKKPCLSSCMSFNSRGHPTWKKRPAQSSSTSAHPPSYIGTLDTISVACLIRRVSSATEWSIPGRWTLTATSPPPNRLVNVALYTCPRDAQATGFSDMDVKICIFGNFLMIWCFILPLRQACL